MNKSLVLASLVAAVALAACGKKEEAAAAVDAAAVSQDEVVGLKDTGPQEEEGTAVHEGRGGMRGVGEV